MAHKIEAPVYQVLCDEDCQRFYQGAGRWTEDRDKAQVFGNLADLMAECDKTGIKRCKVVEIFPRTGTTFGLYLQGDAA